MPNWLTKDLGWKLFSVILAVVIWLTINKIYQEPQLPVSTANSVVTYENLPVYIVSSSADVRAFRVVPRTVSVTVRGPSDVMAKLQADQIRVIVDLTNFNPNDLRQVVDVSTPPGVTLVSVEPSSVGVIVPAATQTH